VLFQKKFQIIADRHNFKQLHLPVNIHPQNIYELECGPMPNVMAALPPSVQHRKLWLIPTTRVPCINVAKTQNPLKFAGVPQTRQQISAVSRPYSPYYEDMWRRYRCLTSCLPIVNTVHALSAKIQPDKVVQWSQNGDFFVSCIFREPRAVHFRPAF